MVVVLFREGRTGGRNGIGAVGQMMARHAMVAQNLRVHLTYDTSGVQCRGVRVMLHIFNGGTVDHQKRGYAATTMTPLDATAAAAAAAFVIVP